MIPTVYRFNREVVKHVPAGLLPLSPSESKWLVKALREEAEELEEAPTLVDQVDAVIDTAIFALGGLYRMGLTEDQALQCFMAVMDANMTKKSGQKAGREVEGVADAIKPAGWVPPEARIAAILGVEL